MTDLVPSHGRIDRTALERIIQRAAELQAGEREIGEGLTEGELMALGEEVGIPAPYLRRALVEERTRSLTAAESGAVVWLAGPARVAASRTIAGTTARLEAGLGHWMKHGELLQVKRRYPDQTVWEAQQGAFASIKRSLGFGGRRYLLAEARDVAGCVIPVDEHRCHVRLVADLRNTRRDYLVGGGVMATLGTLATGAGFLLGVIAPVAVLPAALTLPLGFAIARGHRAKRERIHVALEQVLDRLEHGEIRATPGAGGGRAGAFVRIADEIKKSLLERTSHQE